MPEEHNRVLTDHAADLLLAPTEVAASHLAEEGLADRTVVVGDAWSMSSSRRRSAASASTSDGPTESPTLPTCSPPSIEPRTPTTRTDWHRSSTRSLGSTFRWFSLSTLRVRALAADRATRTRLRLLVPVEPLDYDRMIAAVRGATAVATDSGGLQKEAFVLGTPTTTIRTETEWVETLVDGWNVLSPAVEDISANITRPTPTADRGTPYGSVWRR